MKIPKTIRMAGVEHSVELKKDYPYNNLGSFIANDSRIILSAEMVNDGMRKNVLLHEIIEAANYHYELNLKHNQITALAGALNETGLFLNTKG